MIRQKTVPAWWNKAKQEGTHKLMQADSHSDGEEEF
jgi:hypothetical protein